MDRYDSEYEQLLNERNEFEERCRMLESELTSKVFEQDHDKNVINDSCELNELRLENNFLREQLDMLRLSIREIEQKVGSTSNQNYSHELDRIRQENSKLKID